LTSEKFVLLSGRCGEAVGKHILKNDGSGLDLRFELW
jgi:hypothetical protein